MKTRSKEPTPEHEFRNGELVMLSWVGDSRDGRIFGDVSCYDSTLGSWVQIPDKSYGIVLDAFPELRKVPYGAMAEVLVDSHVVQVFNSCLHPCKGGDDVV